MHTLIAIKLQDPNLLYTKRSKEGCMMILLEDFGGKSLEKLSKRSATVSYPMPLNEFLTLAIQITEIFGKIHAALIDENQKQAVHLQIGRNLLQKVSSETVL